MARWQEHIGLLAKAEGYVARSAYKLRQIQQKHNIIHKGDNVLDLGCNPGAWLQVACQLIGPIRKGGQVVGIDIKETTLPLRFCDARVMALQADVQSVDTSYLAALCRGGFNVVLSDMCHDTSGNAMADAARSLQLGQIAAELAVGPLESDYHPQGMLQGHGNLVIKLLQGSGSQEFAKEMRQHFRKVAWMQPEASRSASREMYLLGLGRRLQPG